MSINCPPWEGVFHIYLWNCETPHVLDGMRESLVDLLPLKLCVASLCLAYGGPVRIKQGIIIV